MTESPIYLAALEYARAGTPILPVKRGSKAPHPILGDTGGFHHATTDVACIDQWFGADPSIDAIGAVPGRIRCAVVDIDPKHDGFSVLREHETRLGKLPDTRTTLTPSGGEHRWYRLPDGVEIKTQNPAFGAPGVDVISRTGYVLMPPSRHPNGGRYELDAGHADLAPLPQAWIDALSRVEAKPAAAIGTRIEAGNRNGALTSLAGSMRHRGMSEAAIDAALQITNREQCDPPLEEREVSAIARSVSRYEPAQPVAAAQPALLTAIDAADLLAQPYVPPAFLVKHLVPDGALVLFTGDTGAAKTALLIHLCVCLIAGIPVAGRFEVRPGAVVLYVNGEMGADTLARYLHEATAGLGVTIPPKRFVFEGARGIATWRFGEDPAALAALIAELRPELVVLDTQRALLVDDESDTAEVRRVFAWIRTNIVNAYGTTVVVAHHLRKIGPISNSARERVAGSRDIIAVADVHLAAESSKGAPMHAITMDKTRSPFEDVRQGTQWPVEARLERGSPNRSHFIAHEPESPEAVAAANASADDRAADEMRARLGAEGALTIDDLNAKGGAAKRALSRLQSVREVVAAGKRGRKTLYALRESLHDDEALL